MTHDGVLVIIGPNGSGKTRLGAAIEAAAQPPNMAGGGQPSPSPGRFTAAGAFIPGVRRIGAQRVVSLPDTVQLVSNAEAQSLLQRGGANNLGVGTRLTGDAAVGQMQDYTALVQALFADRNATANAFLETGAAAAAAGTSASIPVPTPVIDRVVALWDELFPHRRLVVADQSVRARPVEAVGDSAWENPSGQAQMVVWGRSGGMLSPPTPLAMVGGTSNAYPAGQLSDGERVGFYLIAHAMLAEPGTTLLVDEPETYLHPRLQEALWDALEVARPDCAFVYLTHNLEFAASRRGAPKIVVRDFRAAGSVRVGTATVGGVPYPQVDSRPAFWTWELVAPTAGVPEDVTLRIAGARRPTLFVEGTAGSLDAPLYRALYPEYEIVPVGSCEVVIRTVRALRDVRRTHRLAPAGLIDPDDRDPAERLELAAHGVHALGVAQVENVYADERVFRAVVAVLRELDPDARFADLRRRVARLLTDQRDALVRRRALRTVDRRIGAWAAPLGTPAPQDAVGFATAFARAAGDGDPARVVTDAFAAAASDVDMARAAVAAPLDNNGGRSVSSAQHHGRTDQHDSGYVQALAVLRHKGIGRAPR